MNNFTRLICLLLLLSSFSYSVFTQKRETMTVKVYFTDSNDNPNLIDCAKVKAVSRTVPKTKGVAKAALNELFKGATKEEEKAGLSSWFSNETKHILKNVNIKDGNAYVNFDKWILQNMGNATTSCGSASFFANITSTLKQFPTVKNVYFAVEKDPKLFYEWMQFECPDGLKNCDNSNF